MRNLSGVKIMGVINVSPESFYAGSIPKTEDALAKRAVQLTTEGADMIDVGAMSTAPYLETKISATEEADRLGAAVKIIRAKTKLPISIDTSRFEPALAGLQAGATHLNDVTGLNSDAKLLPLLRHFKGVILMAHPSASANGKHLTPIIKVKKILAAAIQKAVKNGVKRSRIIVDPGIGFFRDEALPWWQWDLDIISHLKELGSLKCPLLVGISRKSFIGKLMGGAPPEKRLEGSLAVTRIAVQNSATWVRTHDVKETKLALIKGEVRKGGRRRRVT